MFSSVVRTPTKFDPVGKPHSDEPVAFKCQSEQKPPKAEQMISTVEVDEATNQELKQTIWAALGGSSQLPELASQPTSLIEDPRSRTNSLRNGETSKVITQIDLECPSIDKEKFDEYMKFKAHQQQQHLQALGANAGNGYGV